MTRIIRAQFEHDDVLEAQVLVPSARNEGQENQPHTNDSDDNDEGDADNPGAGAAKFSLRLPAWVNASYATIRPHRTVQHRPNPFGPREQSFARLGSMNFEAANKSADWAEN